MKMSHTSSHPECSITGYRVEYDDGDVEDLYAWDLIPLLQD